MIKQKAYAKLDLAIHINPKKRSGLYPVDYLDCQLNICDKLSFFPKRNEIEIICNNPQVPTNEENFIYKAGILLKKMAGHKNYGAKIILEKQIPVTAGFGGGSADAAAAVRGFCKLWKIKLTARQFEILAKNLGKDFFYSLYGGLGEIESKGRNYVFKKLTAKLPEFYLVVVVPQRQKPSTEWIYKHLKAQKLGKNLEKFEGLKKAILANNQKEILANLHNDFEDCVWQFTPQIVKMKHDLAALGAKKTLMAGAGLTVVGFFDIKAKADEALEKLTGKYPKVIGAKII